MLPFAMFLFLAPNTAIVLLFGEKYLMSANVLRVLAVGYSIQTLFGPNGLTLVSTGRTKEVFVSTVLGALGTVVACILLVPEHGALGAAIGTSVALALSNLARSLFLFYRHGIHALSLEFIKPVSFTIAFGLFAYGALSMLRPVGHPLPYVACLLLMFPLSLSSPFFTKSITPEDMATLKSVETRIHRKTLFSDRIHSWLTLRR
jgi:O-antigen/teichoic acid export membrane protein